MRKKIAVFLLILSLILVLGISLRSAFFQNSEQSPTLESVLSDKNCDKACWAGFEPFVASRDSVEDWLNDSGESYSMVTMGRENDTLIWNLTTESPLVEPSADDQSTISMEFSENNILWRITLMDIHICADNGHKHIWYTKSY